MEAFNVIGDLAFDPNEESNDDEELRQGGDDEWIQLAAPDDGSQLEPEVGFHNDAGA